MKPTLFLVGPSDIEGQSSTEIESSDDERVRGSAQWSGTMSILPYILGDPTMKAHSKVGLVTVQNIRIPNNARLNIFNLVGDAAASKLTLGKISTLINDCQPFRCFNHPENVLKTTRERLPRTLADIPGCHVPRVMVSKASSHSELIQQCEKFDCWPLIVRAQGYHSGMNMLLVNDRTALDSLVGHDWIYQGVLLIEFVDCKSDDMLYTKHRVIMVDGVPYPRHSIRSDNSFIHSRNRSDLMDQQDHLCLQEERLLEHLAANGFAEQGPIFKAIYERIGLDIFGIDYAMVDGQMIIFEANACMNFLTQDYGNQGRYKYLEPHIRKLKRAVKKLLMTA